MEQANPPPDSAPHIAGEPPASVPAASPAPNLDHSISPDQTKSTQSVGGGSTKDQLTSLIHWTRQLVTRYRWFLVAAAIYLVPVLIISRLEFVATAGQYPQGTNALNAFLIYDHWRNYPLQAWFYPWTDWGELSGNATGPNVLYAGALTLNISTLIRFLELGSLWASGCTMYILVRGLRANSLGAFTAGFCYLLLQQTPQFFEGHVPTMISLTLAPLYLLALHRLGIRPRLGWGVAFAVLAYLIATIGDLSVLYFLLCCGIPLFVYDTLRSGWYRRIGRPELIAIATTTALFIVLMAPWLVPYVAGVRPKYFTDILGVNPPFTETFGESLALAFQGILQDASFSQFTYGRLTYAANLGGFDVLYYIVPAASIAYIALRRSLDKVLLFAAGLLAIIIATGGTYPGLSSFNAFLYNNIPFFNYIPDLRLWLEITILVYSIFIGWILSDVSTSLATAASPASTAAAVASNKPILIEEEIEWTGIRGIVHRRRVWAAPTAASSSRGRFRLPASLVWILPIVFCGLLLTTVILENQEAFATPPVLFRFPDSYIDGFQYIARQPDQGGVFSVPYTAIYERTPWGGVSVSSLVMSTYFTGDNGVVFEGGTPYSVAMDEFVAKGEFNGDTNNLTKFLTASNIQWITATNYTNWAYASSSFFSPEGSYERLTQQLNLGAPVYQGGVQTVYQLPDVAGNVSFHPTYLLYFGSTPLLNEITNEPSYNGSQVLVNGSALGGSELESFAEHSSGLWGSGSTISGIAPPVLAAAVASGIPVNIALGPEEVLTNPDPEVPEPFDASNGEAVQLPADEGQLAYSLPQSDLIAAGASTLQGDLRASCVPGTALTLSNGDSSYAFNYSPPGTQYEALNLSTLGPQAIDPPDKITVSYAHGEPYLTWTVVPSVKAPQYFRLNGPYVQNLTGVTGFTLTLNNDTGLPPVLGVNLDFNNTWVRVFGEPLARAPGATATTYSFNLATDIGPGASTLNRYRGNLMNIEFGMEASGTATSLNVTNLTLISSPNSALFQNVPTPTIALTGSDSLGLSANSQCLVDTLTLSTINPTGELDFTPYYEPQPDPTSLQLTSINSGWGILLAAQTYADLWGLSIDGTPVGIHVPANIGLNGWLVNLSEGAHILITYNGQSYVTAGTIVEGVGLSALVAVAVVVRMKRRRAAAHRR
jgi:hypothetical protein